MSVANKKENPFSNLLYGMLLVLFGSFALMLAWTMWQSIDNWFFMTFTVISFALPAFAAFFLGARRLVLFVKFYSSTQ
jgi:hypothetical protein